MKIVLFQILSFLTSTELCKAIEPRKLSQAFLSYVPKNDVHNNALIDLDQKELGTELLRLDANGFSNALKVYKHGAHSYSFANLTLKEPLGKTLLAGTPVYGVSMEGTKLEGSIMWDALERASFIYVAYNSSTSNCFVGGSSSPYLNGCFATNGDMVAGDRVAMNATISIAYSYTPSKDNRNRNSLQKLSTVAKELMWDCSDCPHEEFRKFYQYYGEPDYADDLIMAAFNSQSTKLDRAGADFSEFTEEGRGQVIKMTTIFMNIWMYVIWCLEAALDACENCSTNECKNEKSFRWDSAVAYYTGSKDGSNSHLLYEVANELCRVFNTCDGQYGDDTAKSNVAIFDEFILGQQKLLAGRCSEARKHKEKIVKLMTIPLVQSTILYAHVVGLQIDTSEFRRAEMAVSAASVLPLLHSCSPEDSEIVANHMKLHKSNIPSFDEVKAALERNYACLGVSCSGIGGIVDERSPGNYKLNAAPCVGPHFDENGQQTATQTDNLWLSSQQSKNNYTGSAGTNNNVGLKVGLTIGFVGLAAAIVLVSIRKYHFRGAKEYDGPDMGVSDNIEKAWHSTMEERTERNDTPTDWSDAYSNDLPEVPGEC